MRSLLDILLSKVIPQSAPIWKFLSPHHTLHEKLPLFGESLEGYVLEILRGGVNQYYPFLNN
jgi:hypothetical protein